MTGDTFTITKSDMYVFAEAPLHLWALKHGQLTPQTPSAFEQILMQQGQRVEMLARQFLANSLPGKQLQFQPEFTDGAFEARLDALVYDPAAEVYDLYEIKSSTRVKKEAIDDVTFQALVVEANLPLRNCYLVLVNSAYNLEDSLDIGKFLSIHDITEEIALRKPTLLALRTAALSAVQQADSAGLAACYKPAACAAPALCHPALPNYHIYDIPRLSAKKVDQLRSGGQTNITAIPPGFALSENQQVYVDAVRNNAPLIDHVSIQQELGGLEYPLYFLDYETFGPAIPYFRGFSPYRHITFQFSVHRLHEPGGRLDHYEYLNTQLEDPSAALAEQLANAIGPTGSVIVWNRAFEHTRNKELALHLPAHAAFFTSVNDRMYDLMEIFSKNLYVHPACRGSASIKNVLPVLCPDTDQSYDGLEINKGDQAMAAWMHVTSGELTPEEAEHIRTQMYAYCKLDTFAMYKIWEHLHTMLHQTQPTAQ